MNMNNAEILDPPPMYSSYLLCELFATPLPYSTEQADFEDNISAGNIIDPPPVYYNYVVTTRRPTDSPPAYSPERVSIRDLMVPKFLRTWWIRMRERSCKGNTTDTYTISRHTAELLSSAYMANQRRENFMPMSFEFPEPRLDGSDYTLRNGHLGLL